MSLISKPDFDRVRDMWDHYWAREVRGRPLVWATVTRPGVVGGDFTLRYLRALTGRHDEQVAQIDRSLDATLFLGESIPSFGPDLGPDQFAAFLGTDLVYSVSSPDTNWARPVVEDWDTFLPMRLDPDNRCWRLMLDSSRKLAESGRGRYLVSVADLHGNADALSALRTPQRLCMDFYDYPDQILRAMTEVRAFYRPVYDALYEAGGMGGDLGSTGWAPFWSRGKFATIQCDFLALVSPEISRKYIIPALEEEAGHLDHCVYHLDGPGCIPHLDDILAIKDIEVIQWVPGAGQPPLYKWMDLLKKCQAAGKGLQLYDIDSLEILKLFARELDPTGLLYCLSFDTEGEVREAIQWLERNT